MAAIYETIMKGRPRWCVDVGVVEGKRRRRYFKDEKIARKFFDTVNRDRKRLGDRWAQLDAKRRDDIVRILESIADHGRTIEEVWQYYQEHAENPAGVTVQEAYNQFYAAKASSGVTEAYLEQLRYQAGNFSVAHAGRDLGTIRTADIETWLAELDLKPATRQTHLARLGSFFEWCFRHDMIEANPCVKADRVRVAVPDPEILTVDQCRSLVHAAMRTDLGMLYYLGLALFMGIRPHEALRVSRSDVDLDQGVVILTAEKSKVRNRRIIQITAPARKCLEDGKQMPKDSRDFRTRFDALRQEAGISHWPHDALRKTCASHFYNLYGIEKATEQLGHSAGIMLRNYRALVSEADTEAWMQI